jgi:adhesin/invasin
MGRTRALRWITLLSATAACGGGGDLLLPGADPAVVTLVPGDGQNGRVGEALPQPLVVSVTDASGRPIDGATVVFVLSDPAPGASVAPDTTTTNADGDATANVVLGTRPGTQAGEVQALGGNGSATAHAAFTVTALPENANGIVAVSGQDQSGPVGTKLGSSLVVQVSDAFGNPIEGVVVTWTADGGGSVSAPTTTTGADGTTSVERTLGGTAGTQRTFASVDGLAGSPVTFVHTATAGAASGVTIVAGDDQIGPISTELPQDLVVEVRDAASNPVPSVAVTWVIGVGAGSVTPTTSTTDASGRATAAWTLGPVPGPNTVSAVVSGIGVAEFSANATAGAPARLAIQTQPSSSAVSGVALGQQPIIQLLDALGNEAKQPGVAVTVSIASGNGTLSGGTSQQTDGNGRAAFSGLTITGTQGTKTLRFSASGFASVTSQQISLGASPTTTTITSDSPDPSRAGDPVTVKFTVTSNAGTPDGSVTVQDGTDTCSGTLSSGQGSCVIRLNSLGTRNLTATYGGSAGFATSSAIETHNVQAPPQPVLAILTQPASTATAGTALSQQPVIQLKTGDGADLSTAGVAVSAAIATGGGTLSGTTTVMTDAQGRAAFTDLAINGNAGQRTLVFTATGYTNVTSGTIDVQAAADGAQSAVAVDPSTIAPGATSTITVTVRDAGGSPLGGRSVTVTATGSENTINDVPGSTGTGTTGSDGVATFVFSSTTSETKTISATSGGVGLGLPQTITVEAPPTGSLIAPATR